MTCIHGIESEEWMKEKAKAIEKECGDGAVVKGVSADLRKGEEIRDVVREIQKEYGSLDILCNNAGLQYVCGVETFPESAWREILDVCLTATFLASKAALPGMLDRGWGRIVNTGSMHSLVASPYKSAYNAAKHGVAGFTKTLALEVATRGVTVNAVCPGYAWTELIEKQLEDQAKTRGISKEEVIDTVLLADQPIKRFVKPDEIGALVRHLCSEDAGAITGSCISIDGGWTAR